MTTKQRPLGTELMTHCWILTCKGVKGGGKRCGYVAPLEHWDVMGACEGQAICPECFTPIVIETGKVGEPCGECDFCGAE